MLADELEGIFDEKAYFNSTMETCAYCVKYEERHPPPEKGTFFIKV